VSNPSTHRTPRRRLAGLLAAVLAVTASLGLAACGSSGPSLPTGHSDLESIIEAHGFVLDDPEAALTQFKAMGVDIVRDYIAWNTLAPDPNSRRAPAHFDAANPAAYSPKLWASYDAVDRDAAKIGIGLDVTVGSPPPLWAASPGAPPHSIHAAEWKPSASDFGAFMHALGERYSGHYTPPGQHSPLPRVNFWSIWNEPNYGPYLAPQAIDDSTVEYSPLLYRGLVDAAWTALAATGHTTKTDTILIGETAPRGITLAGYPGNFSGMVPLRFIRALYCVGSNFKPLTGTAATLRGCPATAAASARFSAANPALFDASGFADHPYPDAEAPTYVTPPPIGADYADFGALGHLETTLDRAAEAYGRDVRLPIYSTEYGYFTKPPAALGVSLATAATYLNETEYLSWRNPRIKTYDQYLLTDPPPGYGSTFDTGLLFSTGAPKPDVYAAYLMPLWMPVTHTAKRGPLVVWGCARSAPVVAKQTNQRQRVAIEFAPSGSSSYRTVKWVTLAPGASCYFVTTVKFPASGSVRLSWLHETVDDYSRTQAITL
jgi:hypothetical protein